jgi:hypothetical protein
VIEPKPFDAEKIYLEVGRYVVAFQGLEAELTELGWLLAESRVNQADRATLAKLPVKRLAREVQARASAFRNERRLEDTDSRRGFWSRFDELLLHCEEVADQRNSIVHSAYVHLEAGGEVRGILRSDMSPTADRDDVESDQDFLAADSFTDALLDLGCTTWKVGQGRRQVIAWRDKPPLTGG